MKEADDLFLDSKRSAKRLTENKEKYLQCSVCNKHVVNERSYLSSVIQSSMGSLPTLYKSTTTKRTHLVTPARSPFLCIFVVHHSFPLVLLDSVFTSKLLPLRLLLLRNGLLSGNSAHTRRKSGLDWRKREQMHTTGPTSVFSVGSSNKWLMRNWVLSRVTFSK